MKKYIGYILPAICLILCSPTEKDCIEASGQSACDELEESCDDDFNRVIVNSALGSEQCSCCK